MKPTSFEIQQCCTRVTIEWHEDKLVTIFELKEPKILAWIDEAVKINTSTYEQEMKEREMKFKDGDIIKIIATDGSFMIAVKKGNGELSSINESYVLINYSKTLVIDDLFGFNPELNDLVRFSPESLPIIQDALAKVCKVWNAEKKCIEELKPKRWRAVKYCAYWFVDTFFEANSNTDRYDRIDNGRFEAGNYFQTEQQSKDFAERIKQLPR